MHGRPELGWKTENADADTCMGSEVPSGVSLNQGILNAACA